ncbi:kinetochore protein Spc24 isoform X2 [Peromyscus leucopus]|uniref:kinetochore protein Spc24 isoform X2 n=1 Tax=Peromyscus leucopus TaxID=10041 RepID=UPI0010A14643|nr:kinetochore protein Spc24 isoform X2 [Peromyscus leucopus]
MAAFRDMEEVSYWLLSLLGANRAEAQQRRLLGRYEQMVERLLETQDGADQRLRETLAVEEEVAQSLLELKECTRLGGTELQQLEAELQKASKEDACLQARLCQLTTELRELQEMEADLQQQEREVDEDTTITIPSAVPPRPHGGPAYPPEQRAALTEVCQRLPLEPGGHGVVARALTSCLHRIGVDGARGGSL